MDYARNPLNSVHHIFFKHARHHIFMGIMLVVSMISREVSMISEVVCVIYAGEHTLGEFVGSFI